MRKVRKHQRNHVLRSQREEEQLQTTPKDQESSQELPNVQTNQTYPAVDWFERHPIVATYLLYGLVFVVCYIAFVIWLSLNYS